MNKNQKVFMWYKIKELSAKGLNKSQISRELELDRGTVRKYLQMDEQTFSAWISQPKRMPKKLSEYYKYVKNLLESTPYLSAAQVEDRLKESYQDLPEVNSKTVYNFVKSIREQHDIPKYKVKQERVYEKLPEVDFGSEAQCDFGEYNMQTDSGRRVKVYFFVMVLSRSRYKYVYFQQCPFTSQTAVYAHELAFEYFQGIPKRIIYDQDRVFVKDENLGDFLLTDGFRSFCQQEGFEAVFCRKADPESKGKVENVVKYVKYNFLQGRQFTDQAALQQACIAWLSRTANTKIHSSTRKIPYQQWLIEQDYLLAYRSTPTKPLQEFPAYKVRKDNTVAYKGNFYSLPLGTYQDNNSKVLLKNEGDHLQLLSLDQHLLASHKIPLTKGGLVQNTDHHREKSKSLREKHALLLEALGNTETAGHYLEEVEKAKPRYYRDNITVILKAVGQADQQSIQKTLQFCLAHQVLNGNQFVEVLDYHQQEAFQQQACTKISLPEVAIKLSAPHLEPDRSNIDVYEIILNP